MNIQKDDLKAWKDDLKLVEYLLFQIKTKKKVQETNQESTSPKSLNLNQKNWFFWSNRYKIEVASLIKMLELANFSHMTTSTMQFESRVVGDVMGRNYNIITFI